MRRLLLLAYLLCVAPAFARDASKLQTALKDTDVHPDWIYNDLNKAFAEGRKSNKPILAVVRCVV